MRAALSDARIVIGGIVGTPAEHINHMRAEGVGEQCISYFIGKALGDYVDGKRAPDDALTYADLEVKCFESRRGIPSG